MRAAAARVADLARKDWTPLVRDLQDLLRISFFAGIWVALAVGHWQESVRFGLTFAGVMGVRLLDPPRLFDLLFGVAMGFQAWGNLAGAYDDVPGYAEWTHFVVSLAFAPMLYLLLVRLRVFPDFGEEAGVHRLFATFLAAACLGFAIGVYYELYIWFANHFLLAHFTVSWDLLTRRLGLDWLGGMAGGVLIALWDVYGWSSRRTLARGRLIARAGGPRASP